MPVEVCCAHIQILILFKYMACVCFRCVYWLKRSPRNMPGHPRPCRSQVLLPKFLSGELQQNLLDTAGSSRTSHCRRGLGLKLDLTTDPVEMCEPPNRSADSFRFTSMIL